MKKENTQKKRRGFTLIESMIFLLLFALISTTFFQAYIVTTRTIIESRNRLGGTALANQRMEIIRSIEYTTIGTKHWNGSAWVYGIPAGDLIEEEDVSVSGAQYHVDTFVQYVDDAFDGVTPADTIPTDYKRVRITVSWGSRGADQQVALFGSFSPNGVESSSGGGVLSVNVLDAGGNGVSGADVRIQNSSASIDTTATTDATGNITLPGAPAGTQKYILTVSKSGYFGANTYAPYPTTAYNPVDVHATVVANVLNQKSIVMDRAVNIKLSTEDPFGSDVASVPFTLAGGRLLGTNPSTSAAVYNFSNSSTTDGSGEKTYSSQSYGQYTLTVPDTATHTFWKITPETTATNLLDVLPGANADIKVVMVPKNTAGLWVTVVNDANGLPVSGATVKLSNATLPYDVTRTTDAFGKVYFPESTSAPLSAADYSIEISATGYTTKTDTVTVGTALLQKSYNLVAN